MGDDNREPFPPPLTQSDGLDWADDHNPYSRDTANWYLYAIRFWMDQADKEHRRSMWQLRIGLFLVVVGTVAEVGGLLLALFVDFNK